MAHSVTVLGPYNCDDTADITTALSAGMVVADDVVSWVAGNQVWFGIVTA